MTRSDGRSRAAAAIRLMLACAVAAVALAAPAAAGAEDTVWICKPGQADDLCAGTISGSTLAPPGESPQPLGYTRPDDPPVDCFYLYPTQSEQPGPNADLSKDPPIRRVVVQQARMFSTVCDVYAPMYRQVTYNGDQSAYNDQVETAYQSAKAAFEDFRDNYNGDRGFILIGHSQGAAHVARLIDDFVDPKAKLRERFVGAIAPGANISVPIDEAVGGMYENVPACTGVGEYGCVTAFSTYSDYPGAVSAFARLDSGYWIYPEPRPDASRYEAMCADPARLDGGDGTLLPLANLDYLTGAPPAETADPWIGEPDYYRVECKRQDGAHWLNLSKVGLPGDTRIDLGALVASGTNYHVPELNLAEGNLLRIAQLQTDSFEADRAELAKLERKLAKTKQRRAETRKEIKGLQKELRSAGDRQQRALKRKLREARDRKQALGKKVKKLRGQIAEIKDRMR